MRSRARRRRNAEADGFAIDFDLVAILNALTDMRRLAVHRDAAFKNELLHFQPRAQPSLGQHFVQFRRFRLGRKHAARGTSSCAASSASNCPEITSAKRATAMSAAERPAAGAMPGSAGRAPALAAALQCRRRRRAAPQRVQWMCHRGHSFTGCESAGFVPSLGSGPAASCASKTASSKEACWR